MAHNIEFSLAPIPDVEAELGRRLEAVRLAANISQAQLAADAGVSRRTVTRLENGGGISVETLIRIMRALGIADRLATLLPEPGVRPIERIRFKGRQRQRARASAKSVTDEWRWAEPSPEDGAE